MGDNSPRSPGSDVCLIAPEEDTLGILDTFHDFCKSARISAAARANGKTPDRLAIMREYLPKLMEQMYRDKSGKQIFKKESKDKVEPYTKYVRDLTCGEVSSVGDIEHAGDSMFAKFEPYKSKLDAHLETKETITFEDIIKAYKEVGSENNPVWNRFKNKLEIRILEIQKGDFDFHIKEDDDEEGSNDEPKDDEKSDKKEDYAILAKFILQYYFFIDTVKCFVTFDAGKRFFGKIFQNKENVRNVIFPQTIADSATTSFSKLGGPNLFLFPSKGETVQFTSNYFSKNMYKTYFKNNGFGDTNEYGFSIIIEMIADPKIKLELPFGFVDGSAQTEGPSVNYLVDLLDKAQHKSEKGTFYDGPYADIKKKGTILNIGKHLDKNPKFKEQLEDTANKQINGIFPDLKRGGDHEAVLAAKYAANEKEYQYFIFSTIDILCALRARLEGLNTVYQGTDKMILYRNIKILPTEAIKEEAILKAKGILNIVEKLDILLKQNITKELEAARLAFAQAKNATVPYSNKNKDLDYKRRCEESLNALLRLRMLDLENYVTAMQEKGDALFTQGLDYEQFREFGDLFNDKIQTLASKIILKDNKPFVKLRSQEKDINAEYKKAVDIYNSITVNVTKYVNIDWKVVQTGTVQFELLPANSLYSVSEKGVPIFTMKDNAPFGFYPGAYVHLYETLLYIHEIAYKNSIKSSRDFSKIITNILKEDSAASVQYFKAVETVLDEFLKSDKLFDKEEDKPKKTKIMELFKVLEPILDIRPAIIAYREDVRANPDKYKSLGITIPDRIFVGEQAFLIGDSIKQSTAGEVGVIKGDDKSPVGVVNKLRRLYNNYIPGGLERNLETYDDFPSPPKAATPPKVEPAASPVQETGASKKPAGKGKRGQTGGAIQLKPDAKQYNDLSDLLYTITSRAAAFIESAYTKEYPLHVLNFELEKYAENEYVFQSFKEKIEFVKKLVGILTNLKSTETLLKDKKTFTTLQAEIDNILAQLPKLDTEEKIHTILYSGQGQGENPSFSIQYMVNKFKPEASPPFVEFLTKLQAYTYQDEDTDEIIYAADDLYKGISALWEAGLYEIRQNQEYLYTYLEPRNKVGLNTEDLISYILSLDTTQTVISSNLEDNKWQIDRQLSGSPYIITKAQIKPEREALGNPFGSIKPSIFILFLLTLINNIMDKTKHSYFMNKDSYMNKQYDAKEEWNLGLWKLLHALFDIIKLNLDKSMIKIKRSEPSVAEGGGHAENETKRNKNKLKSTRYRKTRKNK